MILLILMSECKLIIINTNDLSMKHSHQMNERKISDLRWVLKYENKLTVLSET